MTKSEIRRVMSKKRNEVTNKDEMDEVIKKKLKESNFYKGSKNIFIYVGFKSEINTLEYIKEFLEEGKRVFIPRTDIKTKTMEAVEIKSLNDLEKSSYGILEPKNEEESVDKNILDFIIFPGLAFDKNGYRVGYGAGYYDKFMKDMNGEVVKAGLCYDFQVMDSVPFEKHDTKVNYILTEKRKITVG